MAYSYQEIILVFAIILAFVGSGSYIVSILRGKTKPHFYTHLIWSLLTFIAFFAQLHDKAGPGAWAVGTTGITVFFTAILALKYGEKQVTRGDKFALIAALIAMLPWIITDDPLGSVILVTIIDIIAYYPTMRKSWNKPWEENLTSYSIGSVKFALSIAALTHFTPVTTVYPSAIVIANSAFIFLCLWRRQVIKQTVVTDI